MEDHHLAAIMFTDIVGYTSLMQEDKERALEVIRRYNSVVGEFVERFHGEIGNDYGDGNLCLFPSASEAVTCALEIQKALREDRSINLRIGLHTGEVFHEGNKILGDAANIASRIQSLGQSNTVLLSAEIHDILRNDSRFQLVSLGLFEFKNIAKPLMVYALANDGLHVPSRHSIDGKLRKRNKALPGMVIVLLLLGLLSLVIYSRYWPGGTQSGALESIAVLPFVDLSMTGDQEYLGDGISEAIINTLSHIEGLKVIGRTSSFSFKNNRDDLKAIGRQLGVESILEGSVQKSGTRLRITAQLIRASDGSHIWSEQYDRDMQEIFVVQDDISEKISHQIQVSLTVNWKKSEGPASFTRTEAYQDYLKGQFHWNKLTKGDLDKAMDYFELALDKDTLFAPAYAGISQVWTGRMQMGYTTYGEAAVRLREAALKANALDTTLFEVHEALTALAWAEWNWSDLEREIKATVRLNPNNPKMLAYNSNYLYVLGRGKEGDPMMSKALSLDPVNPLFRAIYGMNLMYGREYPKVISMLENQLISSPDDLITITTLRSAYHQAGRFDEAYRIWKKSFDLNGDLEAGQALENGFRKGGYRRALQRVAELYVERYRQGKARAWLIGTLYTRAGLNDEALIWLERAYLEHDLNMPYLRVDPIFDNLKDDRRYKALLRKLNLQKSVE